MSLPALGYAMDVEAGSPTRKLVLIALAECHNRETGRCDPGIEHLVKLTELGERAIRTALTGLAKDGIIGRERKRGAHGHLGTYRYTFPLAGGAIRQPAPDAARPAAPDAARQPAGGAAQNQEELPEPGRTEPKTLAAVPAAYDPRKGTKINGRNIPWDALVEVTQADEKVEAGKIAKALKLIRGYVVDTHAEQAFGDERGEHLIAGQIRARARLYRQRWPNMELTPTALASNWARVTTAAPGGSPDTALEAAQRGIDAARRTA